MTTTITTQVPENVLERIAKMLKLAGNNPNENEAALAMSRAQELMDRYNLDLQTVGEATDPNRGKKRDDSKLKGGLYKWQRDIWAAVARMNFCIYWSIKGTEKGSTYQHRLLGSTVNVASTRMMAEYLQGAVELMAREEYANDPKLYFGKPAIAFREGVTERITERLQSKRWAKEAEARRVRREQGELASRMAEAQRHPDAAEQPGTALVTILDVQQSEDDLNNDHLMGWEPGTTAQRRIATDVRRKEMERLYREEEAERAERERLDRLAEPEKWERIDAARAKVEKEERAREERNAARRKGTSYRAPSKRHDDHYKGYDRGDEVSLDTQVGSSSAKGRLTA